jgi:hypothetical protein
VADDLGELVMSVKRWLILSGVGLVLLALVWSADPIQKFSRFSTGEWIGIGIATIVVLLAALTYAFFVAYRREMARRAGR